MDRLLVTGDIHGSYTTWLIVKELLHPEDGLVIAGDFFDTRFGSYANEDFQPGAIKKEAWELPNRLFYVYGNCDSPQFFPDCRDSLLFQAMEKTIFLHHGHKPLPCDFPQEPDIIIQGHTHICELQKTKTRILMNPGSISRPRNGFPSYGIIERNQISIHSLATGKILMALDI